MNEVVKRLARAHARGWRQEMLVTELLTDTVVIFYAPFHIHVGESGVQWRSYVNLRNRLITAGFVFTKAYKGSWAGVRMSFPEEKT